MKKYRIAVIAGDGIGPEVVTEGQKILEAISSRHGIKLEWISFPWGCQYYLEHEKMMPANGIKQLEKFDSIFLGAVGYPGVPDHISLWGLLIPIRRYFDQYVNLRPTRLFKGISSPLQNRSPQDIDFIVIRENVEGEYSEIGGRLYPDTDYEIVTQESVFTRRGVDRILNYAFESASLRHKNHLTSATKSNGIIHTMPFWDERFKKISKEFPHIKIDQFHIDILCSHFVNHPDWFDVVVGSNLFGDILSDLGAAVAGSIGLAASANINPNRKFPSMFEPVHGSAPDIAGKGIANPIGQIWSGALMLEHLGHPEASQEIMNSIEKVLQNKAYWTPDLGGSARTKEVGKAIIESI